MAQLLALAAEAAGGHRHHLVAVQLPVSLVMMTQLRSANALDFSRAVVDGSHIRALTGDPRPDEAPLIEAGRAASIT
ncbi:hypothetical protein GCM10010255_78530 [Streptomyces coeruleofuscus]|uniref:Uncharacterized protein n=1 Tax=Streptomyces coeruleofuscus TaxID=66879 RepID=A0ABP5WFD9_9ACTN